MGVGKTQTGIGDEGYLRCLLSICNKEQLSCAFTLKDRKLTRQVTTINRNNRTVDIVSSITRQEDGNPH